MQAGYPEVVSSENGKFREADGVSPSGRQQCGARQRECVAALRSRRPQACMETSRARTERLRWHPRPQGGGAV